MSSLTTSKVFPTSSHWGSSKRAYLLLIPPLFSSFCCTSLISAEWGCMERLGPRLVCRLDCSALFEVQCRDLYLHTAGGTDFTPLCYSPASAKMRNLTIAPDLNTDVLLQSPLEWSCSSSVSYCLACLVSALHLNGAGLYKTPPNNHAGH